MKFAHQFLPVFVIGLLAAGVGHAQQIAWHAGGLDDAKRVAGESGRLLLVHFSTTSCVPCERLERAVFQQPSVALAINQRFVPVRIDAERQPETAKALNVTRWPTDVILTPDGTVLAKLVSPGTPMEYIGKMTQVANRYNSKLGSDFAKAAASSPYGAVVNRAYADLALLKKEPKGSPFAKPAETKSLAASATKPTTIATAPRATPEPAKPKLPPAQVTNPYAAQAVAVKAKSPPAPATDITPITPIPPTTPVATSEPKSQPTPAIAAAAPKPASAPALGFDGYCPVTMKNSWQWKKGDPKFGVIHRGKTYLFAGQAEKEAFFQNPDDYAPVLSGVDPVAALEQGRATPGKRQFAIQYPEQAGPFYLFSSEENLKKFSANPQRYAHGVRQAMAGVQPTLLR